MDLLDDLDQYVAPDHPGEAPVPEDDDGANQLLRRIRRAQRDRREVVAVAKAERDRIDAWERDRLASIDARTEHAEQLVEAFMRAVAERRHIKTLTLPNGVLRLRAPRTRVEVINEDDLRFWLLARVGVGFAEIGLAGAVPAVIDALAREPMLSVKIVPAKGEIAKATEAGPVKGEHEDVVHLVPVIAGEGEAVPGVIIERPTRDTFTYDVAKTEEAQEEA